MSEESRIREIADDAARAQTRAMMREVAEEAADKAVKNVFRRFGVDPADQQQVNRFRDGVVFAARARSGLIWAFAVVSGAIVTAWAAAKDWFAGG